MTISDSKLAFTSPFQTPQIATFLPSNTSRNNKTLDLASHPCPQNRLIHLTQSAPNMFPSTTSPLPPPPPTYTSRPPTCTSRPPTYTCRPPTHFPHPSPQRAAAPARTTTPPQIPSPPFFPSTLPPRPAPPRFDLRIYMFPRPTISARPMDVEMGTIAGHREPQTCSSADGARSRVKRRWWSKKGTLGTVVGVVVVCLVFWVLIGVGELGKGGGVGE
ncbi:hypothetical protein BDU57DRAFT_578805 [Ampelomyces quisqualis]|uniref:Uncharacterized protein n=1 Tax=Ampelomyces quisqualis TaxID=50730 RepID=A0A6A5QFP0_AMPQU|nr:hypothetical protein BDU57DRAFT_578805 [Ampelomyces quisqualis]